MVFKNVSLGLYKNVSIGRSQHRVTDQLLSHWDGLAHWHTQIGQVVQKPKHKQHMEICQTSIYLSGHLHKHTSLSIALKLLDREALLSLQYTLSHLGSRFFLTRLTNVSISAAVMCFSKSLRLLWRRAVIVSSASTS